MSAEMYRVSDIEVAMPADTYEQVAIDRFMGIYACERNVGQSHQESVAAVMKAIQKEEENVHKEIARRLLHHEEHPAAPGTIFYPAILRR